MGKTVFIISCLMLAATLIASLAGILTTGGYTRVGLIPDIVLAATGNIPSPELTSSNTTIVPTANTTTPPGPIDIITPTNTPVPTSSNTTTPITSPSPPPQPSPNPGIKTPRIVTGGAVDIAVFEFTLNGELADLGVHPGDRVFEWWRITDDIRTTDRVQMTGPVLFPLLCVMI
jgi:hypothetical protein